MKCEIAAGHPINVERLLETRALIQAASGFGKSWALRRLLEQTAPLVQQIVIDPEGEFASLRERFDYVICAPHGADAIANPRTAALLARRLLETGVSAILDIYDLKKHERRAFVAKFATELVNAPKRLWHPVLIILDEADVFAPETDKAESTSAIVDLAARGRKRGQSLICATQRLAKFSKDVAAELMNKMIGRAELDVDVKRAASDLGMTPREAKELFRGFDPGDFFIYGPALTREVTRVKVGDVVTTHPRSGARLMEAPPAPSTKIKGLIAAELADLPQQAETEIHTLEDAKKEVANLRRALTIAEKAQPVAAPAKVDVRPYEKKIAQLRAAVETLMKFVIEINARDFTAKAGVDEAAMTAAVTAAVDRASKLIEQKLDARNREVAALQAEGKRLIERIKKLALVDDVNVAVSVTHNEPFTVSTPAPSRPAPPARARSNGEQSTSGLPPARQKILDQLAWLEQHDIYPAPKETLAAVCEVSPTSGGYFNNLGALRSAGLIEYPQPGSVGFTEEGRAAAVLVEDDRPVHERWLSIVPPAQQKIIEALIGSHPEPMSKDDLASAVGVSNTSGGYFNNLGRLRTLGAIDYPSKGSVALTRHVMPQ